MSNKPQSMLTSFQSPATAYEIALTEISKSHNSKDEKIIKVFQVLDEIVPNLGIYSKIMKIVRQQLFDAVFSSEFTGSRADKHQKNQSIERMSYHMLYKNILTTRDLRSENLQDKLKEKEEALIGKDTEIEEKNKQINELKKFLSENNKTLEKVQNEIEAKNNEIEKLEKKIKKIENQHNQKIEVLESNIQELNNDLDQQSNAIKDISVYKNAYDELHAAFCPSYTDHYSKPTKRPIGSNRKTQISVDILNAKKLEEQILTLINVATEEYDKFMEKQNEFLLEKFRSNSYFESSSILNRFNKIQNSERSSTKTPFLSNSDKNIISKQLNDEKMNYHQSINELKNQYDLIVQHRQALEEKLYLIEVDRETNDYVRRQKMKANMQSSQNTSLQGLEEHYEPVRKGADRDQFSVQDRIFSKWSCIMYTSINGTVWHDCKLVKFCENCGDKTLICPHKLASNEAIIKLPTDTQYLKFSRPKLQFNQFMVKRSLDQFKKQDPEFQLGLHSVVLTNYKSQFPQDSSEYGNAESLNLLNEGNPEIGMPHNFQRIWFDYSQRTSFKRQVSRPFTYERTISILKQFLAYLHSSEASDDYQPKDIVNSLYEYFEIRYEIEEIKYSAIFDFLTSINIYAAKSRLVEIFCHVLIGNLDRALLNYLLYMAEIIDKIEWQETDDAKIFFAIIYPYCDDEDLDTLVLDYISFSENKINKKLVLEFIMSLIMKKKDYIINEMEFRLGSQKIENENEMTEEEFCKAIEQFFFIADERQSMISYRIALSHAAWDELDYVPINKLAHITSYFCLVQIMHDMSDSITKIVNESRQKILENELKFGPVPPKGNQKSEFTGEFIRISEIDEISQMFDF